MIRDKIDIISDSSGSLKQYKMEIGDQGLILDIIRSKVYADPIGSICREILTNASDAHIEAGIADQAIEVTLPNAFSNDVVIRDFGPGISPGRMADVYAKYGVSTKTKSNDQVGSFGIGSKSVFSYTPQFTVISTTRITDQLDVDFFNESCNATHSLQELQGKVIKSIFVPHLTDDNMGGVNLVSVTVTNDHTGLAVHIPVQSKDVKTFVSGIIKYTAFWNVRPIVHGDNVTWPEQNIYLSGVGWEILNKSECQYVYSSSGRQNIVISNIPYPIDFTQFENIKEINSLKNVQFNLFFNTGELSVSASREQIYYNDKTKLKLIERMVSTIKEVEILATQQVELCGTYREAVDKATFICSLLYSDQNHWDKENFRASNSQITWQGNKVGSLVDISLNNSNIRLTKYFHCANSLRKTKYNLKDFYVNRVEYRLVINDVSSGVNQCAISDILKKIGSNINLIVISPNIKYKIADHIKKIEEKNGINIGVLDPIYLSQYFVKQAAQKREVKLLSEAYLIGTPAVNYLYTKESVDLLNGSGVYVTHSNIKSDLCSCDNIVFKFNHISQFSRATEQKIHSFNDTQKNKIGPGWVPLKDFAQLKINKEIAKNPHLASTETLDEKYYLDFFPKLKNVCYVLGEEHAGQVAAIESELAEMKEVEKQRDNFSRFYLNQKKHFTFPHNDFKFNIKNIKEALSKYEILFFMGHYELMNLIKTNRQIIDNYIRMADAQYKDNIIKDII